MATITVFKAADTSIVTYRLSNDNGEFKIPGIPANTYCRVLVSFSGYMVFRKEFRLSDDQQQLNLGTIAMVADATNLDEVLVIAERPPMMVRKDTIEFNASAFKTLPNALVEDLLKKLPGVQVDKNGNIMVNGKQVNRILVDGKSFFGDDPKMATRNLPSNVIDKIQVTDDKEELLQRGDDNTNNVGKVINLTFKKGVKKGLFGKAYAGGGGGQNGERYEGGAIANIFRDTLQVSVLGYTNNLNRPGFSITDMRQIGGMSRNSAVSGNTSNSSNNSTFGSNAIVNGINLGGMSRLGGVTASTGLGFNLNHSPNNKQSIYAQYFYGSVKTDLLTKSFTDIFKADTTISNISDYKSKIIGNTHTFGVGANLKPDTLTTIIAHASYILANENTNSLNIQTVTNNRLGELNNGTVGIGEENNNDMYMQRFMFTRLSKTKKRRFTIAHRLNWNNKLTETYTDAFIHYKQPVIFDSTTAQMRGDEVPNLFAVVTGNYSEPIVKNFYLRLGAIYEYEKLRNTVNTYDQTGEMYDKKNEALSSKFKRTSNKYAASAGIEYKYKSFSITPAIRYQAQRFDNEFLSLESPVIQEQTKFLPQVNIVYKKLEVNYNRDVVLPEYSYIIPALNNTNPYIVRLGNPGLLPAIKDEISLNFNNYNPKNSLNVWSWLMASATGKDVVQNITLDESGVQTILPVNANGSKRMAANFGLNQDYKNQQQFTFSWNFGTWTEYRQSLFLYNLLESKQKRLNCNFWSGIGLNWNDKLEWNGSYSFSYMNVKNTNKVFSSISSFEQTIGSELIMRYIKHVIFETEANYSNNNAFADPQYRRFILWNAGINFTFFKDERAVLRMAVTDILNKSRNTDVIPNQNTRRTVYSNIIGQYFLATFTYNLRPSGAKKTAAGGKWSLW